MQLSSNASSARRKLIAGVSSASTVIGDQTSTYTLSPAGNPFSIYRRTTIKTTTGDGVDGASGTAWTIGNAGTIEGYETGLNLEGPGAVTNTGSIAGDHDGGVALLAGGDLTNRLSGDISGTTGVFITGAAGMLGNNGQITGGEGAGAFLGDGGDVFNSVDGVITGRMGVHIKAAFAWVVNGGKITGHAADGVLLTNGGAVRNKAGGVIAGQTYGVQIAGPGFVTNYGSVLSADGAAGVDLRGGGDIANARGAKITGSTNGVSSERIGNLSNAGLIRADLSLTNTVGIRFFGGNITNDVTGVISGGGAGILTLGSSATTITNAGAINAAVSYGYGYGIHGVGNVTIVNQKSGTITGATVGILVRSGAGDITNAGRVEATSGGHEVYPGLQNNPVGVLLANGGTVTNQSGGSIFGAAYGVVIDGGPGKVTNAGTIDSTTRNLVGVTLDGSRVVSVRPAEVYRTYYVGVMLTDGGDLTNQAGGRISSVELSGGPSGTIVNAGQITGGVYRIGLGGSVTNKSGGDISGSYGVFLEGGGVVTNQAGAVIEGSSGGIFITSQINQYTYPGLTTTVTNAGQITATGFDGIRLASGGTVINQAGGTITGGAYGVAISGGSATVINAGTITGGADRSISFFEGSHFTGHAANELILRTGSTLVGSAFGSGPGSTSAVILQGTGEADNDFNDFNTLSVEASGVWKLGGDSTFGAATIASGVLEIGDALHPSTQIVVSGTLANSGLIEVAGGEADIVGAVSGTGSAAVAAGTLAFGSSFTENVAFTGASGVLELAKSQSYAGTISGFSLSGGTSLDLGDIGFTSGTTKATYVDNGSHTGGVLSVSDGTHTAHIHLTGNFSSSSFTTSSDGHGGTTVVDPPKTAASAAAHPAALLPFIAAMASFDTGACHWVPSADSGRSTPGLLAMAGRGSA